MDLWNSGAIEVDIVQNKVIWIIAILCAQLFSRQYYVGYVEYSWITGTCLLLGILYVLQENN